MNTCKTCKWWLMGEDGDKDIAPPLDPDTHQPIDPQFEARYCKHELLGFYFRPEVSNGASMVDATGYRIYPVTGEDFGCVNWEEIT